jgi:hypothetical protein
MSALRTADYRTAIESLGFVVVEGERSKTNAGRIFYVTTGPSMFTRKAIYDCTADGVFRLGTVGKRDYLSWPEFITALQAVKK